MEKSQTHFGDFRVLATAVSAALLGVSANAQDLTNPGFDPVNEAMEEVVATYRLLTAAESLTDERINLPFSADFLGADAMARAGDPDIGTALRRVPGLTLVDGKFVYVRGLGERYSSVLVNGAAVPSPDLTRSVIPLDLFPTSIVESIKIQKSPSPDQPAAFGGGSIDIRTASIPQDVVATIRIGAGFNSISHDTGLRYPGGGGALPLPIVDAINAYQGDITISNIFTSLRANDINATVSDARVIHEGLINSLNTNVGSSVQSLDEDFDVKLALGNAWDIGDDWRFGMLLNATTNEKTRNENQHREGVGAPTINFVDIEKTVVEERNLSAVNFGLDYADQHSIEINHYVLQNDEDEASISRGFDQNNLLADGDQKLNYSTRLEQRELTISQISAEHAFYDGNLFPSVLEAIPVLSELEIDWFYSQSKAATDIPNESDFQASALLDASGHAIATQILATTSSGQFSFLELEDNLDSWGGNLSIPLDGENIRWTLSGGWWGSQKDRSYSGYNVNLNSVGVQTSVLNGTPGDVLLPGNLTVSNGFDISLGSQFGTESYVAAQKVDAGYAMADAEIGTDWRFTFGARLENYQHAVLPLDLLDFSGASIANLQNQLMDPAARLTVNEDDIYPSFALTRSGAGLLNSEQFQIRFSYGETVVRPDLREVADVVYLDPELDIRVQGNTQLRSSPIKNFEVRSEFYYASGDNFSASLFYKDIQSPIERIRSAGSDDDVVLGFANAQSGEVYGVEFEGVKQLWRGLFVVGNVTLSESELSFGTGLSSDLTNLTRRLTGHSEWVANATLGYDSDNGKHSAYLNFNAYGERIFFAGTGLNQDAFEQPFNSLGIVYSYFPADRLEVNFKIDNILDEKTQFEQVSSAGLVARIIEQEVGRSLSISGRWNF